MRVVNSDPKLGISKVVWKFAAEPEMEMGTEPIPESVRDEPPVTASVEPDSEKKTEETGFYDQPEIRHDHMEDLQKHIRFLQQVIESQNQQLKTKDELLRNFQVLLKTEQEQVLNLEAVTTHNNPGGVPVSRGMDWFRSLIKKREKHER